MQELTRRRLLRLGLALPAVFVAARLRGYVEGGASAARLDATPSCRDPDDPSPPNALGPFFKPRSPRRRVLRRRGVRGVPLVVTGTVFSTHCRPVRGALLDFWQADDRGVYDNAGFRLRGHQFSDRRGRYRLVTVLPERGPAPEASRSRL